MSKFNDLFKVIMEDINSEVMMNAANTGIIDVNSPEIIQTIINALQMLWEYRAENYFFESIEPQSPVDNDDFDENNPFKSLAYMQAWEEAIIAYEQNPNAGMLLVSPMRFFNAIKNAIVNIDDTEKTITIQPVEFTGDEETDIQVSQALVNLNNNISDSYGYRFIFDEF